MTPQMSDRKATKITWKGHDEKKKDKLNGFVYNPGDRKQWFGQRWWERKWGNIDGFKDILRQHPKILMWNLSYVPSTNVPNFWKYLENLPWLRAYELEENDAVRLL